MSVLRDAAACAIAILMAALPSAEAAENVGPLAPGGVAIGMIQSDAEATVIAHGYEKYGDFCRYTANAARSETIRLSTKSHCLAQEPVRTIRYEAYNKPLDGSLPELLARMNEAAGAAAKCAINDGRILSCNWQLPPRLPLVQQVSLEATSSSLRFSLEAVKDMEARVIPPKPLAQQPWWVQELAQIKARQEKFTGSERYAQLSASEQKRLGEEAAFVHDYCKGRQNFADLHDCSCVAGKFIDARVSPDKDAAGRRAPTPAQAAKERTPGTSEYRAALIAIADRVADQCPSRPGAANYAYKSCTRTYGQQMRTGLDEFCTCYADSFAKSYMQEPRSGMPYLRSIGVSALQACSKPGMPNPSNFRL